MASLDSRVAQLVDDGEAEEDEDALIDALENDQDLDGLREKRREQLHAEWAKANLLRRSDHGTYQEIADEKTLMDVTTSTKYCVVHFYKPDFHRCSIMHGHLETLASKHLDARFLRLNVDKAPFLVEKLQIRILPCVLAFVDGISKDRIIGFEGLGRGTDRFTTKDLETRLLSAGVLLRGKVNVDQPFSQNRFQSRTSDNPDASDGDDWD